MSSVDPKRRGGRPPKRPGEPKAGNLTLRTYGDLRQKLEAAARLSGRSVSGEVEMRLERSFANDEMRAIIREELAAVAPEITGGPVNIDARGTDHEIITAALRQFHRETKIHG